MKKSAFLNGISYEIQDGETILQFARRMQQHIPTLCDDPRLDASGSCRVCCVDVALTAEGPFKTVASCHTLISEGMHVQTDSPRVQKLRKNIVELVLTDHPLDCLTCEANENCQLQDVAAEVGIREVRYASGADHLDYRKDLSHPYMRTGLSKCINCYRCVRACDEIQGEFVLSVAGRGFDSRIVKGQDVSFNDSPCISCGACAQTCPTAAISDIFQSKSVEATEKVRTVCAYCGVGCNLEIAVKNNQILSITAPLDAEVNAGHTCLKGRYAWRFYNHPDRLQTPLIKKDGEFVNASWDEAYDLITSKLKQLRRDHGANSIAGISSSRCTNEENYLMQKLMRAVIGTNNIDCCARLCHSPTAYGMQQSFGTGAATNSIAELKQTEMIMVIGANPTSAHPVTGAKIKQYAMKGIPLIVIDPVKTELARYADWHIQLRPGTNLAVLNMMAYFIVEAGLSDDSFIDTRCEGFGDYKINLMNIDIDELEKASGVDRNLVKEAAIAYGSANTAMTFHGLGAAEHSQGSKSIMSIANLAMLTGNIGKPGVGVNPLRGQNNVQGAADMGCQPHQGAGYLPVNTEENNRFYEEKYGVSVPLDIGLTIPEMIDAAKGGQLKFLWIMGEDVVQTDPNHEHVVASLANLDFLVVQEIFMSETAKMADVVLPGTSFLEKNGTFTNGERRVQRVQAAVKPLQGCKTDGQIIVEIMNRLGFEQADYNAAGMLEEISQIVPFFAGIQWNELGNDGKQWPVSVDGTDTQILHTESFKRGLGAFHFYPFEESKEVVTHGNKFPFILTTCRDLVHYNSGTMTRRTNNEMIMSEDVLLVNPLDAQNKQIQNESSVRLFSDRGEIKLKAKLSEKVKPGILFTTFHFPELMVNRVTGDVHDEETLCPEYKVVAVDFESAI
ncbi:MAG: formate dehydrogenase subunit alpha [Planctomycetota bacterium]|jgi:formate dehydrogenase major subunit